MDRETAVIRAEMSQTRAEIDRKIARLEDRARELTPRRYWNRHKPEYLADQVLGAVLTVVGMWMAVSQLRTLGRQRRQLRTALASYEGW